MSPFLRAAKQLFVNSYRIPWKNILWNKQFMCYLCCYCWTTAFFRCCRSALMAVKLKSIKQVKVIREKKKKIIWEFKEYKSKLVNHFSSKKKNVQIFRLIWISNFRYKFSYFTCEFSFVLRQHYYRLSVVLLILKSDSKAVCFRSNHHSHFNKSS